MSSTLEQQLRDLVIPLPDEFVPRVLVRAASPRHAASRPRGRRARTLIAGAGAGMVLVGANVAAAEYVPGYREFAEVLPFVDSVKEERVKEWAGVPPARFETVNLSVVAEGFVVTVVGTYADEYRTLVLIGVDRDPAAAPSDAPLPQVPTTSVSLVDAPGREYRSIGGQGVGEVRALEFEPLEGAASSGEPVSLLITDLIGGQPTQNPPTRYPGNWGFTLSFQQGEAPSIAVPPGPVMSGDTQYTIESIQVSGYHLIVEWSATGGAVDRFATFEVENPQPWPDGPVGNGNARVRHLLSASLWPQVVDSDGNWSLGNRVGSVDQVADGVYRNSQEIQLPGPGEYRLRFGHFTEDGILWDDDSDPGWPVTVPE